MSCGANGPHLSRGFGKDEGPPANIQQDVEKIELTDHLGKPAVFRIYANVKTLGYEWLDSLAIWPRKETFFGSVQHGEINHDGSLPKVGVGEFVQVLEINTKQTTEVTEVHMLLICG